MFIVSGVIAMATQVCSPASNLQPTNFQPTNLPAADLSQSPGPALGQSADTLASHRVAMAASADGAETAGIDPTLGYAVARDYPRDCPGEDYRAWISGAVLFDDNGLPQAYFMDRDRPLYAWEETVFKLLGLRWLLMSGLQLDRFDHVRASSDRAMTVVLRRQNHFLALRLDGPVERFSNRDFLRWLGGFEVSQLTGDRRFHSP